MSVRPFFRAFDEVAPAVPFLAGMLICIGTLGALMLGMGAIATMVILVALVMMTVLPAAAWARWARVTGPPIAMARNYTPRYYGRAAFDSASWAFLFGAVLWALLKFWSPDANGREDIGHLVGAGLAFVPASYFCCKRWMNAMCEDQGIQHRFHGKFSQPGRRTESILQIIALFLVLVLGSPERVETFVILAFSTVCFLIPAHFLGVYFATALLTYLPEADSHPGEVAA